MFTSSLLSPPASDYTKEFYVSVVKPDFENDVRVKEGHSKIFDRGIVTHYMKPQSEIPRYTDTLQCTLQT